MMSICSVIYNPANFLAIWGTIHNVGLYQSFDRVRRASTNNSREESGGGNEKDQPGSVTLRVQVGAMPRLITYILPFPSSIKIVSSVLSFWSLVSPLIWSNHFDLIWPFFFVLVVSATYHLSLSFISRICVMPSKLFSFFCNKITICKPWFEHVELKRENEN